MNILGENGLSGIVKRVLDLIFFGGIGLFISLPISVKWYLKIVDGITADSTYLLLLGLLIFTGFFALMIVNEMRKIFQTLNRRDPFMMDNVSSLNRIAFSSFLISFFYILKMIFLNSFFTVIITMVFIIAGFFTVILAEVFRQAVIVKEENDLTI